MFNYRYGPSRGALVCIHKVASVIILDDSYDVGWP